MGLFSLTKKPEEKRALPPKMPSFPEFPQSSNEEEMPEFPAYEPSIGDIKKEITKPEDFEIPVRDKKPETKTMFSSMSQTSEIKEDFSIPKFSSAHSLPQEGHGLFVKIDKFKEAMHNMQSLKVKISEAEKILSSLEELKAEEDKKLENWNSELQGLKEKLMAVDKSLFE